MQFTFAITIDTITGAYEVNLKTDPPDQGIEVGELKNYLTQVINQFDQEEDVTGTN